MDYVTAQTLDAAGKPILATYTDTDTDSDWAKALHTDTDGDTGPEVGPITDTEPALGPEKELTLRLHLPSESWSPTTVRFKADSTPEYLFIEQMWKTSSGVLWGLGDTKQSRSPFGAMLVIRGEHPLQSQEHEVHIVRHDSLGDDEFPDYCGQYLGSYSDYAGARLLVFASSSWSSPRNKW